MLYPYIITFSAGFMLSVMLIDFIPHLIEPHHSHTHKTRMCPLHKTNEYYECKKTHTDDDEKELKKLEDIESEKAKKNDGKKHSCKSHFNKGLFTAGLAFIFLIAIDSIVLNHSHCDNKHEIEDHTKHNHDSFGTCNTSALKYTTSMTQAIILILALSIHSFFEGLAINKDASSASFETGILIHKILESFTLGVTMASSKFGFSSVFVLSTAYSCLTPLGMFVSNRCAINNTVKEIFNGLALGSTLFIACIEMIPPIFHSKSTMTNNFIKIGCLAGGYLFTSAIITVFH